MFGVKILLLHPEVIRSISKSVGMVYGRTWRPLSDIAACPTSSKGLSKTIF